MANPHALDEARILALYEKYRDDLARVRRDQTAFHRRAGYLPTRDADPKAKLAALLRKTRWRLARGGSLKPQLDDLEAEITYLRLRESKPESVVEISPCGGWSTTYILSALRDNGKGKLYSYDLVDLATRNVPKELAEGRWVFSIGDVTKNLSALPSRIDYLFIDSDHSAKFAQWYIDHLFPRLVGPTPVSVHDVYHTADATGFDGEGKVIVDYLTSHQVPYFTASPKRNPQGFEKIMAKKRSLQLDAPIHRSPANSMIFFALGQ